MSQWPIWVLTCLVLGGCQIGGASTARGTYVDCPSPNPCDDPDQETRLLAKPAVTQVDYQPLWPGCPTTLQVMVRLHRIAFHAIRPDDTEPETAPDPSDFFCGPPDAPLQRAEREGARHG